MSKLEPLVAAPHSPDNRKTARECSDTAIDRVYIGSCTGALPVLRCALPPVRLFHVLSRCCVAPLENEGCFLNLRCW